MNPEKEQIPQPTEETPSLRYVSQTVSRPLSDDMSIDSLRESFDDDREW